MQPGLFEPGAEKDRGVKKTRSAYGASPNYARSREYYLRKYSPENKEPFFVRVAQRKARRAAELTEAQIRRGDRKYAKKRKTRAEIKAAGGLEYAALLEKERIARARFRAKNPDKIREYRRQHPKYHHTWKGKIVARARARGRNKGLGGTIQVSDIHWPEYCPALGIKLFYPDSPKWLPLGGVCPPNLATLDRWDSSIGYVPGNVHILSFRANTLKNDGLLEEHEKIVEYLRRGPCPT